MSLENLFKIRPRESLKVRNVDEQKNQLTYWICVEESAWSSEYSLEDAVMEGNRGRHAERKEVDGSDHGENYKGEHNGGVNQQIEIVIIFLINIQVEDINFINNKGLVDDCWRWWEIGPVLVELPLFLSSPVTEPNV